MTDDDDRFTDLPVPDRFFLAVDPVEIEMQPMDHEKEDIRFSAQNVPGGRFGFEIAASYEYGGRQCHQHLTLDRESAAALRDALDAALAEARPR